MNNTKTIHWVKDMAFDGKPWTAECGITSVTNSSMYASNAIVMVDCKTCIEKWEQEQKSRSQKRCSFCPEFLTEADYQNSNDFYLACKDHKALAQIETEKFFKRNPDYTKWGNTTNK